MLALGVEHLTSRFDGPIDSDPTDIDQATGLLFPALYAMSASRYLHEHGATAEDLAEVAVKNRATGRSTRARSGRRRSRASRCSSSRMIAEPLTLYQCTGLSDAAAAAVLGPVRRIRARRRDPRRRARLRPRLGPRVDRHLGRRARARRRASRPTPRPAIEPGDADVLEVHDAFTIGEIVTLESMGLAGEGEAPAAVAAGRFSVGGETPVNPSGGLLARGHPLGRDRARADRRARAGSCAARRARARPRARASRVLETMGGGVGGLDGNACVVAVLEKT